MRIAMISEHASPLAALGTEDAGGQNVHVAALSVALGRLGHEVSVYTRRDDPALPTEVPIAERVDVVHVDAGPPIALPKDQLFSYMADFGREVAAVWRRGGAPDIVHAHFWMSGIAAEVATRIVPVPRVQTFHALGSVKRRHQGHADTSPPQRVDVESRLARDSDLVIATSNDERRELIAAGACADRVVVVPCGVDLEAFALDVACETPALRRVVTLTRLVERKGVDVVIQALPALTDVEFVVAGGPGPGDLDADPEARRLRAIAGELGVADRFHLRGRVDRATAAALLGSADVVACTPWYEPFGMVALEAMACGRPVVASATGGLLDTVEHGVTGLHVPPRDAAATAVAIDRLLTDPDLAGDMSAAARDRVESRHGWDRIAARTVEAYTRAVRHPARRTGGKSGSSAQWLDRHVAELADAVFWARDQGDVIDGWGGYLAGHLSGGGRVLAAGNGGSAAQAQHFTAELVGQFAQERRALSALCLSAETSTLTAVANDHGTTQMFARQVEAHGRPGDVLVVLSTSGSSANILEAARTGRRLGLRVFAVTGPAPNALAGLADAALCVPAATTSAIQEIHLILLHAVCAAVDARILGSAGPAPAGSDVNGTRSDHADPRDGLPGDPRALVTARTRPA